MTDLFVPYRRRSLAECSEVIELAIGPRVEPATSVIEVIKCAECDDSAATLDCEDRDLCDACLEEHALECDLCREV